MLPRVFSYTIIRVCGVIHPPSSCSSGLRRFGIYNLINNYHISVLWMSQDVTVVVISRLNPAVNPSLVFPTPRPHPYPPPSQPLPLPPLKKLTTRQRTRCHINVTFIVTEQENVRRKPLISTALAYPSRLFDPGGGRNNMC